MNKNYDFIIVGFGVAACCFIKECIQNNLSFIVIASPTKKTASRVAAGVYNPVVLKRFNPIWKAKEQMCLTQSTFRWYEDLLQDHFIEKLEVKRILNNEAEQRTWGKKSKREDLQSLMQSEIEENSDEAINANYGLGVVPNTGRINLNLLLNRLEEYLAVKEAIRHECFDYTDLKTENNYVYYNDIKASNIIFCEGIHALNNPWFPPEILIPNKGEVLHIRTKKDLELSAIYKSSCFLMPLNLKNEFYVGATYERTYSTAEPTPENKEKLQYQLQKFFTSEYEIIKHWSGLRPTTPDRRPVVGTHKKHKNICFINGMGSRGTLLAPICSKWLMEYFSENKPIPEEVDLARFLT